MSKNEEDYIPEFLKDNPDTMYELYKDDPHAAIDIAANSLEDDDGEIEQLPKPKTDDELWDWVDHYLNIQIPRGCCDRDGHVPPFKAFSDAYFARHPRSVWWGSRGFSGKSTTLATLVLTEALSLGAATTLLGGSGEQAQRVLSYIKGTDTNLVDSFLAAPNAPRWMIKGDPTKRKTFFKNKGWVDALMASQTSVRGPHPNRLRGDEVDDMTIELWDAAQGQPMESRGIREQVVGCSTWQVPNGTMTREFQLARQNGWPIYTWCVPPGTPVTISDGSVKAIEDIEVGEYVLTGQGRTRRVSKTWERYKDEELVEITVDGLPEPILITEDHEIPTQLGWIKAGLIRRGDIVFDARVKDQTTNNPERITNQCLERRVSSVKRIHYNGPVHDLTVEEDHSFHAGGFVVSNCYACVLKSNGGWLDEAAVERKRASIPNYMWEIEYDLAEPLTEGQAFDRDSIENMFQKDLGHYEAKLNDKVTIQAPEEGATYATGADWAKSRDKTWIVTLRTDVVPHRVVAFAHLGRIPFPDMVDEFNRQVKQYDSYAVHDKTGIGSVIHDYLEVYSQGMDMVGKKRNRLFSDYIAGVERGEVVSPMIDSMYNDHYYCLVDDIYSSGGHPPDSVVAMALAYEASNSLDLIY